MPLPLVAVAPVAAAALTLAAVRALRRSALPGRRDQKAEDALERLPEGLTARGDQDSRSGTLHLRRVLKWRDGSACEIDLALIGRLRLRRIPAPVEGQG